MPLAGRRSLGRLKRPCASWPMRTFRATRWRRCAQTAIMSSGRSKWVAGAGRSTSCQGRRRRPRHTDGRHGLCPARDRSRYQRTGATARAPSRNAARSAERPFRSGDTGNRRAACPGFGSRHRARSHQSAPAVSHASPRHSVLHDRSLDHGKSTTWPVARGAHHALPLTRLSAPACLTSQRPHRAMVTSSSRLIHSSALATPASPMAPSP
jgi:hypothetical protein